MTYLYKKCLKCDNDLQISRDKEGMITIISGANVYLNWKSPYRNKPRNTKPSTKFVTCDVCYRFNQVRLFKEVVI